MKIRIRKLAVRKVGNQPERWQWEISEPALWDEPIVSKEVYRHDYSATFSGKEALRRLAIVGPAILRGGALLDKLSAIAAEHTEPWGRGIPKTIQEEQE